MVIGGWSGNDHTEIYQDNVWRSVGRLPVAMRHLRAITFNDSRVLLFGRGRLQKSLHVFFNFNSDLPPHGNKCQLDFFIRILNEYNIFICVLFLLP